MNNRSIYQQDPSSRKLINEGVASVNDERTTQAMSVLRYELETFVCDGQYQKGMAHILETYLKNIDQAQQPAVWVSGFFGSGKSHLVKMLRSLWVDTPFSDNATPRGIARLPQDVRDHLRELTVRSKSHGGLHASSGTLGSGARGSVRLALLRIIFKSAGLPENYPAARFVLWLRTKGIEEEVQSRLLEKGLDWQEELDNFHVAEGLHQTLVELKPNLFLSYESCVDALNNMFPNVADVSSDDMVKVIRQALSKDGKFPLTLIVLDEVQQYIGEDSQRSVDVQEVVEACCKNIGGRLLFIATGQTAVSGTSNLKKLEGRFTIRVELSDADVEAVVRQLILAKKPEAIAPIDQFMLTNLGEVSRHLSGTSIGHTQEDIRCFAQDYPVLPVRRRFWESTLRVLDQTGTDSQLRNQLSMVHKAIQTNLDYPLGHVVAADFLYFDSVDKLLQSRMLPRKVHDQTLIWKKGTESEQLKARACGLVFLINKLAASNKEIGLRPTIHTLADLLVEDLSAGSGGLRKQLPELLDKCELLMKVGDEYRIQTEESAAWIDDFQSHVSKLANENHRIEAEREDRIRKKCGELVGRLPILHGDSKVSRNVSLVFDSQLPSDSPERIYVWIRDGWSVDKNSVPVDARQAGTHSPTIFVFIPKRSSDDLRHQLIHWKAAVATLEQRGVPNTPEGGEARAAMETTRTNAEARIQDLLDELLSGARVFQGGGNEITGNRLQDMVTEAARNALQRLYPDFYLADHSGWAKVYELAHKGAADALKHVGDKGEPATNAVCKNLLSFIASGKKGAEVRDHFESSTYGWPRDAVDGALMVLLQAGILRANDERGQAIPYKDLERKTIGKVTIKMESSTVTVKQRIRIRSVMQTVGVRAVTGDELAAVPAFLSKMRDLATRAGGEAPKPESPDISSLEEIRLASGNDQLLAIHSRGDELERFAKAWNELGQRIEKCWPNWLILKRLLKHAEGLPDVDMLAAQVNTIEQRRQLLEDPDLVAPIVAKVSQLLREELNRMDIQYQTLHQRGMERLQNDNCWQQIDTQQRNELFVEQKLTLASKPTIQVQSTTEVLTTLDLSPLSMLSDRIAAMPSRFDKVASDAAMLCEPKAQQVKIPRRTLKTQEDIDAWLQEVRGQCELAIQQGPVVIR